MFHNNAHLVGRSGSSRLLLTTMILIVLLSLGVSTLAQEDGVLRIGTEPPANLDPATAVNDQEILFNHLIYDYLVELSPEGEPIPNLATDWTISDDGLTYTFNLVEDVTFHDGSSFTAGDVVYTFERLKELGSTALALLGEDFVVEAVDDTTVQFTLPEPNADFLFGVASRFALIIPEGLENPSSIDAESDEPFANFNGTGPFVLTDYQIGQDATFTANENYWMEGLPVLDGVEMIFIEDDDAQINALRTGTVDFIFRLPLDQVPVLESEGIELLQRTGATHPVIRLRTDEGSLGEDPRVREAFKLATDRELLNLDVNDGLATVGNNDPISPAFEVFYTPIEDEYNPERACELLAEAGYTDDDGNPLLETTLHIDDQFNYAVLGQAIQAQWQDGCINVDLNVQPSNIYYDTSGNPDNWLDVQLGLTSWGDRPVPQQFLNEAYVCDGPFNESRWCNPDLDMLVQQASQTADIEERAEIYAQISQIFAEEGPIIVPYFIPVYGAITDRVENLEMYTFPGRTDLREVSVSGE